MDALFSFYRRLFWSPDPVHSIGDYFMIVLSMLPVCLLAWWLIALLARSLSGDLRLRTDAHTAVRLIWARSALIVAALLLLDICLMWYFDKLSDWTAITPHATVACLGAIVGLWTALSIRSELLENRKKLFAAVPKSAVAAAR